MNRLFFGDNLGWLRDPKEFPDETVDLVYLDPPFNSNADYNVLFREASGEASQAQFHAFTDTWTWADAAETYNQFIDSCPNLAVTEMMQAFHSFLKNSPMMAYLAMMAPRLVELHRVLKPTGSLYLHCDPTASHYLRIVLDGIFGAKNFVNEIVWKRSSAHSDVVQGAKHYGRIHDIIFVYGRAGDNRFWNTCYTPYEDAYVGKTYRYVETDGRRYQTQPLHARKPGGDTLYDWKGQRPPPGRYWAFSKAKMQDLDNEGRIVYSKNGVPRYKIYLDESRGVSAQDLWLDIAPVHHQPKERLGYATQKPIELLERIVEVSCPKDGVVLDPFCGCGTTVHAAQKTGRQWIGIDVTYLAINLIKRRLHDAFGEELQFEEKGQPTDFTSAQRLAELDKFQFQHWALSLIDARPLKEGDGKGADRGVDGLLVFLRVQGRAAQNHRAGQRRRREARRRGDVARRREQPESGGRNSSHVGKAHQAHARRSRGRGPLRIEALARQGLSENPIAHD